MPPSKVRSKPALRGVTLPLARRLIDAAERPVGDAGEDREVGDAHRVAAGIDHVRELAGGEDREAVAAELELVDRHRAARRQGRVGEEVDPVAEGAGDLGVGGPDAGGEAFDVHGDVAGRRVVEMLREAAEAEGDVLHLDVGRLEPIEHDEAVPAGCVAEVEVKLGRAQAGVAAGDGQGDRGAGRVAERAGQCEAAQEVVGAGLEAALKVQRGAGDLEVVDPHAAGGFLHAADLHRALAGEEVAELRRDQRREAAVEVDVEAEAIVAGAEGDHALGDAVGAGIEAEVDVDLVERARAVDAEVDGGRALDLEEGGDDAALRFLEGDVDAELAGLVGEGGLGVELAPGRVEALDVERGVERAAGKLERAGRGEIGRLAEDRLGEGDVVELELGEVDRDRKLREREGLGLGLGQGAGRGGHLGAAQPVDALGVQQVDRDAAAQQREPVPVKLDVVDLQPGALGVGEGDALDLGLRRQRAGDAGQLDLAAGGREPALQHVDQEAVVVGGAVVLRHCGDGHEHDDAYCCEDALQNACPMPM